MTQSLFDQNSRKNQRKPLAERMRPRTLHDYIGQSHILGPGRLLRRAIEADRVSSLILYGPPGTGKTTLAQVIAEYSKSTFIALNAVLSGVKVLRDEVHAAQNRLSRFDQSTLLFIDEIHRFNQAQQDALLPWVERGVVTLIGATTENPYFEVNNALNSRSHIFQLKPLSHNDLAEVVHRTLQDPRGYADRKIDIETQALNHWIEVVNGDARSLLNALELAVETTPTKDNTVFIDLGVAEASIQERAVLYDRDGDSHFDTISAFIKSVRGSDPDAALYWLAKMIYAGEPARYIFRRLLIFASEDVGLAWPQGISIVESCAAAFDRVGMPEGRFHLSHAVLAMATAPKSNSTMGFFDALSTVRNEVHGDVPNHLKDGNRDGEAFGHGQGYLYPHAYQKHWVAQDYLPTALKGKIFYSPSTQGDEAQIGMRVRALREAQIEGLISGGAGDPILAKRSQQQSVSPHQKQVEDWVERAMGNVSGELSSLRQSLMDTAQLSRLDRVLDINAGAGLLTWPSTRITVEGGVWSVCLSHQEAETLSTLSSQLPWIHQPHICVGNLTEDRFGLAHQEVFQNIQIDHILGRSLLGYPQQWEERLKSLLSILSQTKAKKITIAEPYLHGAQRLSTFVQANHNNTDSIFLQKWIELESQIYLKQEAYWTKNSLEDKCWSICEEESSFRQVRVTEIPCDRRIRLSSHRIKKWVSTDSESYVSHLQALGADHSLTHLVRQSLLELVGQLITWRVSWVIVHFDFDEKRP